ncbi:MAG: hypothetical protein V4697_00225 [Patescibacteria group bacterium]
MKKIIILVIVLAIIGGVVWKFGGDIMPSTPGSGKGTTTDVVFTPASGSVKVSEKISEYKNDELGFSVKYPTPWIRSETASNVTWNILPSLKGTSTDSTVTELTSTIEVFSGKCTFPPVTTVKERGTLTIAGATVNMISIANTVQGINYFNRMYSLQKNSICYFFSFASVTASPASKGITGTDAQRVGTKNKTIVDTADTQFRDMVKTFNFVVGPKGEDEAKVSPKK